MLTSSSSLSRTAWLIVLLLMPVALLNYLDRQMLAAMKFSVMADIPSIGVAIAFRILFGIGWGFFDCNNMPILSQIVRPHLRATGYGIMNLVSISFGGLADWRFGLLRDRNVPINAIFSVLAATAIVSVVLVLLIRPRPELSVLEKQP